MLRSLTLSCRALARDLRRRRWRYADCPSSSCPAIRPSNSQALFLGRLAFRSRAGRIVSFRLYTASCQLNRPVVNYSVGLDMRLLRPHPADPAGVGYRSSSIATVRVQAAPNGRRIGVRCFGNARNPPQSGGGMTAAATTEFRPLGAFKRTQHRAQRSFAHLNTLCATAGSRARPRRPAPVARNKGRTGRSKNNLRDSNTAWPPRLPADPVPRSPRPGE